MKRLLTVFLLLAATFCAAQAAWAQEKYALVIGNGNYTGIAKLGNPVNDANDVAAALEKLGFTVQKLTNATLEQIENASVAFKRNLSRSNSAWGFFFYAGHGVQANGGQNYLIPVDAAIASEAQLKNKAFNVQQLYDELSEAGNALNVVVLDACRDNPFGFSRGGSRGLALVAEQPKGSLIMYATRAGQTAADGSGRNGLFTSQLLKNLSTTGLELKEMFTQTGADVQAASGGKQSPAIYVEYFGKAYLAGAPAAVTPPPAPAPAPVTPPVTPQPPSAPVVTPVPAPAPAVPVTPAAPPRQRPAKIPANMVWVEGGTFSMGSDNDPPVHEVTVNGFCMGKYEVTQKEWFDVMGTNPSYFKGNNLPVEQVNWLEAVEYCNKRSIKEGLTPCYRGSGDSITCDWNANGYRLPTEAEWEYAAKGGVKNFLTTEYSGSNSIDAVAWYGENSSGTTHPVGKKAANSLGIHDMSGNVWEWCWDWYGSYPSGAQSDPRGAASGSYRVPRGGSWHFAASYARSANRVGYTPSHRDYDLGFRVVRL